MLGLQKNREVELGCDSDLDRKKRMILRKDEGGLLTHRIDDVQSIQEIRRKRTHIIQAFFDPRC
jgi:hypothetical protein